MLDFCHKTRTTLTAKAMKLPIPFFLVLRYFSQEQLQLREALPLAGQKTNWRPQLGIRRYACSRTTRGRYGSSIGSTVRARPTGTCSCNELKGESCLLMQNFRPVLNVSLPLCRLLRPLHCQMRMTTCEGVKLEPSVRSLVL